jgi:hypothetical protein
LRRSAASIASVANWISTRSEAFEHGWRTTPSAASDEQMPRIRARRRTPRLLQHTGAVFLKTERTELAHLNDVINAFIDALDVEFEVRQGGAAPYIYPPSHKMENAVANWGQGFADAGGSR